MSYAAHPTGDPYGGPARDQRDGHDPRDPRLHGPERVSALAVTSLVLSLLCCIPFTGGLGFAFGALSLFVISQSNGRLSGKGLAIGGMIIGAVVSALWVAGIATFNQQLQWHSAGARYTMAAVTANDPAALRVYLTPTASAAINDAEARAFIAEVNAKAGPYSRGPESMVQWFENLMEYFGKVPGNGRPYSLEFADQSLPIPIHFEKAMGLVVVHFDPGAPSAGDTLAEKVKGTISQIVVVFTDGTVISLPKQTIVPSAPPIPPPPQVTPPAPVNPAAPSSP